MLKAIDGKLGEVSPEGYVPVHAVGNGKLSLIDPKPTKYPTVSATPNAAGDLVLEVRVAPKP